MDIFNIDPIDIEKTNVLMTFLMVELYMNQKTKFFRMKRCKI